MNIYLALAPDYIAWDDSEEGSGARVPGAGKIPMFKLPHTQHRGNLIESTQGNQSINK